MIEYRWFRRHGLMALAFLLAACSAEVRNAPYPGLQYITDIIPSEPLHWKKNQPANRADLVTLALSGGGVKSAIFSSETMFYLQAIGLLRKVNLISSVSGGSYAAARYALSCDGPNDPGCLLKDGVRRRPVWDYRTTMATVQNSSLKPLLLRALPGLAVPFMKPTISGPTYARFLNKTYLQPPGQDADFTFADIDEKHRPRLVLNATIVSDFRYLSDLAEDTHFLRRRNADEFFHFAFTDYFFKAIGSDISKLSVSYGIAASGAFPLLIDYVPLANYRNCLRESVVDRAACARDTTEQLALIDGGANDNQGATEIYALLGELLLGQSRSDNSANPPLKTIAAAAFPVRPAPPAHLTGRGKRPETMERGDKALLITANSAITEATGLKSAGDSPPWILGNITRSMGAVDVYSGTEVDLRRRLYMQNVEVANADYARPDAWGYSPITAVEIGLITLNRYSEGGPEGAAVRRSGIQLPPNRDCRTKGYDRIACEIYMNNVPVHDRAWKKLQDPLVREKLMLSKLHPQCLFEQSKLADGLTSGLMEVKRPVAVCLRHAARWATALTMQELCARTGKDSPINDRTAMSCDRNGVLMAPGLDATMRDENRKDILDPCGFEENSASENMNILRNLAANKTFQSESRVIAGGVQSLWPVAPTLSGAELGRRLNDLCDLDRIRHGSL